METIVPLSITDFLSDYKAAKNKDEEAFAISKVLKKVHIEQGLKIAESKKEVIEEISPKDLLTKQEFHREMKHYTTKDDLSRTKWQVIGVILSAFVFTIAISLWLKHMGI